MIPNRPLLLAAAFLAAASPLLHAQQLQNAQGQTLNPIVTGAPGHFLAALDADTSGNIYYLDTDTDGSATSSDGNLNTRLFQRAPNGATTLLFDFGAHGFTNAPFGSFVRVKGNTIYWAENSTGTLWKATLANGGASLTSPTQIGQIDGNYDLVFNGAGEAYLSANPSFGQENRVYRLTLDSGPITIGSNSVSKVFDDADYSGPIVFDAAGNLLYGRAGAALGSNGGLYRFTPGELAGVAELTLTGHLISANGSNSYLRMSLDGTLYQDDFSKVRRIDYNGDLSATTVATATDGFLGDIALGGTQVYAIVSKGFGSTSSAAIYEIVPEPGSAVCFALGLAACLGRRFRRV